MRKQTRSADHSADEYVEDVKIISVTGLIIGSIICMVSVYVSVLSYAVSYTSLATFLIGFILVIFSIALFIKIKIEDARVTRMIGNLKKTNWQV